MSWTRVVLGVGNPGARYTETRHNVGFMVLDRVAQRLGLAFARLRRRGADGSFRFGGKVKAMAAEGRNPKGEAFLLAKPLTYVNLTGDVAGGLVRHAGISPDSLFVVLDDLNLPLGRMRCRPAGSSGGHGALKSIEQSLSTSDYPRLRLGIGEPSGSAVDHVLDRFLPEEQEVVGPVLDRAAEAVCSWIDGASTEEIMNRYNGPETRP